jgi:two-component system sensor histidine kinase HydH
MKAVNRDVDYILPQAVPKVLPGRLEESAAGDPALGAHVECLESVTMLVRRLSHSLNNILAISRGNVLMLRESISDQESLAMIGDVLASLSEAQALSENLAALGTHRRFTPEVIAMSEFLKDYVDHLRDCREPRWHFHLQMPEQLPWVTADPRYLKSALDALVNNACEAMDPNVAGEIGIRAKVATEAGKPRVCIMVLDSAGGLSHRDPVLPFSVGATSKGRHGHIGLGLWYARQVMRACGGDAIVRQAGRKGGHFIELALSCADQS